MKILVLSNFYPPYERGGQEMSCEAIVNGLRRRGHEVEVLTSDYGGRKSSKGVFRELKLEMDFKPLWNAVSFFICRKYVINYDISRLKFHIRRFQPDLVFICGMWNMPRQVPAFAEILMPGRVLYRLACYWPTLPSQYTQYWQAPAHSKFTKIPKKVLGYVAQMIQKHDPNLILKLEHVICISEAMLNELMRLGVYLPDVQIVHNGINFEQFNSKRSSWLLGKIPSPLKLLYLGRISPEKGVHTAIRALKLLVGDFPKITLSIAGYPWDQEYLRHLKYLVFEHQLTQNVEFLDQVSPERVPQVMQDHHVLLVPSIWPEPFGRVVLEGMAAGMVVVGTAQGGMQVVLRVEETGLVFQPEDEQAIACHIRRLLVDLELGNRLAETAVRAVQSHFSEEQMVSDYEIRMLEIINNNEI
jgi:glycosyltransferase involved in cell wall biosynthesis